MIYVYPLGDMSTPAGVLDGNNLYDTYRRTVIAAADSKGGLYLGHIAAGSPDFVLDREYVREFYGSTVLFTIRGNGICDGNGTVPVFHCVSNEKDVNIALALTAIANAGDLRFRHQDADVVDESQYIGIARKKKFDNDLDYSNVYGDARDPFEGRTIPEKLSSKFEQKDFDDLHYRNIQAKREAPKKRTETSYKIKLTDKPVKETSYRSNENDSPIRIFKEETHIWFTPEENKKWKQEIDERERDILRKTIADEKKERLIRDKREKNTQKYNLFASLFIPLEIIGILLAVLGGFLACFTLYYFGIFNIAFMIIAFFVTPCIGVGLYRTCALKREAIYWKLMEDAKNVD